MYIYVYMRKMRERDCAYRKDSRKNEQRERKEEREGWREIETMCIV